MTLRGLARGSAIYAAGNVLARLGGFILLPIYLQLMTRQQYGLVALVTAIVGLLNIVCRLGLDGALMRLHFDTDDAHRPGLYRTLMVATLAISGAFLLLVGLLVGPFFETIFFGVQFVPYGLMALAVTFVGSADYVPSILYRATQQPERFFLFNLGSFVLASTLSLALVLLDFGAFGVLLGQLIAGAIVLVVVVIIAMRPAGPRWHTPSIEPALRFGVPLVPHQISMWILRLSDRWLLGLLLAVPTGERLAAIGAYSVGYQLGSLVAIVGMSFNAAWTPYFYRIADEPQGPNIYREILTLTTAAFLWMALGLAATSGEVIAVIARPGYAVAAQVLPVVAFACVLQGVYTMLVGPIFLRRRTALLPALTVASAAANVLINIILIPRIGVMGAAWATLTAYALFASLTFLVARRIYPVRLDYLRLAAVAVICLIGALVADVFSLERAAPISRFVIHVGIVLACGALIAGLMLQPIRALRRAVTRSSAQAAEM